MGKTLDYTVTYPLLLENITVHRTPPCFRLGIMEESTETYLNALKQNLYYESLSKRLNSSNITACALLEARSSQHPSPTSELDLSH